MRTSLSCENRERAGAAALDPRARARARARTADRLRFKRGTRGSETTRFADNGRAMVDADAIVRSKENIGSDAGRSPEWFCCL